MKVRNHKSGTASTREHCADPRLRPRRLHRYDTGQALPGPELSTACERILSDSSVAYVHIRSKFGCFQCRVERGDSDSACTRPLRLVAADPTPPQTARAGLCRPDGGRGAFKPRPKAESCAGLGPLATWLRQNKRQNFVNTRVAFVPPKPKLLDMTVLMGPVMALAQDLQAFGGGVEVLDVGGRSGVAAFYQRRVDGLTPAAPEQWPEMDLVELMSAHLAPKDFAHRAGRFNSVAHGVECRGR